MKRVFRIATLAMITVWLAILAVPDKDLHIVFCDVGQGEAILISRGTTQLLIDTGSGEKILKCLSNYLPFYDRVIERLVVTHEDKDHAGGVSLVSERYRVLAIERDLKKGDKIEMGEISLDIVWPNEVAIGADPQRKENAAGIVSKLSYKNMQVLLTADVESGNYEPDSEVEVVKVAHHGSRVGWNEDWWRRAMPDLAVISVGKNNYGHPATELLEGLNKLGVAIARTDISGDIEIVSNGIEWWVNTKNDNFLLR